MGEVEGKKNSEGMQCIRNYETIYLDKEINNSFSLIRKNSF